MVDQNLSVYKYKQTKCMVKSVQNDPTKLTSRKDSSSDTFTVIVSKTKSVSCQTKSTKNLNYNLELLDNCRPSF